MVDVADLQPLREQAIARHASQTSPYDGMPPTSAPPNLRQVGRRH